MTNLLVKIQKMIEENCTLKELLEIPIDIMQYCSSGKTEQCKRIKNNLKYYINKYGVSEDIKVLEFLETLDKHENIVFGYSNKNTPLDGPSMISYRGRKNV